jgi:hypothetical protein
MITLIGLQSHTFLLFRDLFRISIAFHHLYQQNDDRDKGCNITLQLIPFSDRFFWKYSRKNLTASNEEWIVNVIQNNIRIV